MGLFTLLLGVMAISLFGSLAAADRALEQSQQEVAELDAQTLAITAARVIAARADSLALFFDPLLGTLRPGPTAHSIAGPRDVWVFDRTGRAAYSQGSLAMTDTAAPAAIARAKPSTAAPTIHVSADGRLLVAVALVHRGDHLGTAVGIVPHDAVLRAVRGDSVSRPWMALDAGRRRVAIVGDPPYEGREARATLPFAGDPVQLVVSRAEGGQQLRRALWVLGIMALGGLLFALARERRQAISLAARTAELERLYQEVARSNRMKSEFLANISHELRTPLNAIVGFVEMLREGVYGDMTPRQALPVDRIAASATHLRQLVDRLLDIAKIAAGRLEVQVEPVVLRAFVLNIASEMESLASERDLSLTISVPPTLPRILTDQTHLRQILINLIGNAVKYTPSGGIQVRATRVAVGVEDKTKAEENVATPGPPPPGGTGEWVALMVTDTGVGIAEADQERIFDEFEQVNAGPRTDSARRGTGLGLAISRRLARLLGGDITVSSRPGGGSTFTVWLPLSGEPEPAEASPEPRARTSA